MKSDKELRDELDSFSDFWRGGTTRPKLGWKKSKAISVFQDLDGIVETCITPFINKDTNVLEIGAGGGF